MKKSTIWLLTIVMALTFGALLYFQLMYLENMVKMRNEQFSESVKRALYATSSYLEREETLHYLEEDLNSLESSLYASDPSPSTVAKLEKLNYTLEDLKTSSSLQSISDRYKSLHEGIRSQYLYQRSLLNEVILTILRESSNRPPMQRADSTVIKSYLATSLSNNGLDVPFAFAVTDSNGTPIYSTDGFNLAPDNEVYSQPLFAHTSRTYLLKVAFPTKNNYIFSSVRFIIPTLAFTLILLMVFIYTIVLAFRQKKITEMKTDFINNMTHELKTPISTISLAGQMLNDDSVTKSPGSLRHLAGVITDETKRLRFQVDKVLQLSMFDKSSSSALKFKEVDVNKVIANVASTFKIKVEKFGGDITTQLDAHDAIVYVDEMQFTNVIFNLLDNAVKYMREDTEPHLVITTKDLPDKKVEIRVKDNGIGIKKEDLKRIFEKFYRVHTGNRHDVKGFGLGLAYVKRLVTLFSGKISVDSEPGVGTTFIITLPRLE